MDAEIVRGTEVSIYSKLEESGIDHKTMVVSDVLADFSELLVHAKEHPEKFRIGLSKLRQKALEPYMQDKVRFKNDIHLINVTYAHLINYVSEVVDPKIEAYLAVSRKRKFENVEWVARGTGTVLKSTAVGTFRHAIPASMIAVGGYNLMKASAILGAAINTVNNYANDPVGRCQEMNMPKNQYAEDMKEYEKYWFASYRGIIPPKYKERETGFFGKLSDTVLCTVPQWTTGVAGNVFSGGAEISGAITSTFAAFTILLMGIFLWLLMNKNSNFGIPFLFYFGFTDPDSKAPAATTNYIQRVAPMITSGAVSPPRSVVREVKAIENKAHKSPTVSDRIATIEENVRQVSPVAQLILESKLGELTGGPRRPPPLPFLSAIARRGSKSPVRRKSPVRQKSPKRSEAPSFLEHIKTSGRAGLKPAMTRKLKSPPKKLEKFNIDMLRRVRRHHVAGEEDVEDIDEAKDRDWDFGKKKSKSKRPRRGSKLRSKPRSRKPRKPRRSKPKRSSR